MRLASFAAASRLAFIILVLQGTTAPAAEIKVWAGGAFSVAMKEFATRFERNTGHMLAVEFAASPVFLKRIEGGDNFDVAILLPATIDTWIKDGKVIADTRTNVARAMLGVGVRAGAPKTDVGSADALKRALLAASTVSYFPGGAIGKHFASVLDRLGIAADMKAKLRPAKAGGASPAAVAKGEAELGIAFIPAIVATPGVELAGPFPGELAYAVDLVAGVSAKAKEPEAAKAFVKLLASPDGVAAIKAKGFAQMP
jgi:molybdate transport system substrate-binding protein